MVLSALGWAHLGESEPLMSMAQPVVVEHPVALPLEAFVAAPERVIRLADLPPVCVDPDAWD